MGAARADPMVCTIDTGVTHCEAPLRHYRVTGTRDRNRTYFGDNNVANSGFLLRRARPIITGTVFHDFDFNLTPDFVSPSSPSSSMAIRE